MAESNIQPNQIIPDFGTLKRGKLDILVNWDITSATKTDDMGNEYTEWSYESVRLNWILVAHVVSLCCTGNVPVHKD